jgi:hypothetical protein
MKSMFLILAACCCSLASMAQKVEYQESQARLVEPRMQVFVKPLIVDLQVLTEKRVKSTPYLFSDKDISTMTLSELESAKINALYQMSVENDADVIVGATFDVRTPGKGKGVEITVTGFPAKYVKWRPIEEMDYQWVRESYGYEIMKQDVKEEKTQAVEGKKK